MQGVLCRLELHVQIAVLDLVGRDIRRDAAKVGHALFIRREILEFGETDGAAVGELHDHLALRAAGRPAPDDQVTPACCMMQANTSAAQVVFSLTRTTIGILRYELPDE